MGSDICDWLAQEEANAEYWSDYNMGGARFYREQFAATRNEIVRLRAELIRTAEVIAAQTFDVKTISKTRMKQLVRLSRELLMIADGGQPIRYYHERTITSDTVRQQYPQLRDALASPDARQEARRER